MISKHLSASGEGLILLLLVKLRKTNWKCAGLGDV